MKRFFALCVILGLVVPFAGCEKKPEAKPAAPAADATPAADAPAAETK